MPCPRSEGGRSCTSSEGGNTHQTTSQLATSHSSEQTNACTSIASASTTTRTTRHTQRSRSHTPTTPPITTHPQAKPSVSSCNRYGIMPGCERHSRYVGPGTSSPSPKAFCCKVLWKQDYHFLIQHIWNAFGCVAQFRSGCCEASLVLLAGLQ